MIVLIAFNNFIIMESNGGRKSCVGYTNKFDFIDLDVDLRHFSSTIREHKKFTFPK